ncbi:DUF2510 domain-containing protein [Nocardioides anomalus]|uniref:DUF2510 domain-containing protein n=1 Tax=Nocardioides anomalus TaxID=2712223 RepID=UPI001E42AA7C|nr:DUF2510 domain-containing protein [Nocardioides anomalus]
MTQTPAGWYADPQDPAQYRYWDGAAWTEHRSPRSQTGAQVTQAANDLADGLTKGFNAVGTWLNQNVGSQAGTTFASVAASCRDEPARQPLSVTAQLVLGPGDVAGVGQVFARTGTTVTAEGARLENEHCRLVPNPWDPAAPQGVAVFIGATTVGRLPAELEAQYVGPLAQLASRSVVATAVADLVAHGPGMVTSAQVSVHLPAVEALAS